jgi:hypothetical protein
MMAVERAPSSESAHCNVPAEAVLFQTAHRTTFTDSMAEEVTEPCTRTSGTLPINGAKVFAQLFVNVRTSEGCGRSDRDRSATRANRSRRNGTAACV